eukprot:CAMPEP_0203765104 /NCGR_PEP_ID=MMETSP0098-20131031/18229_1 /ASSEMBLY_ACC=CAM_ASM_000208 /TAXON_ID=96639 /ORGANISM=" , Strain NY0313808BC1" /LENGTH=623 /DNA_ID=CAMNT_0050661327 /DNA_START=498 /DNA_END=2369 /DNA_ORIENTATION=-
MRRAHVIVVIVVLVAGGYLLGWMSSAGPVRRNIYEKLGSVYVQNVVNPSAKLAEQTTGWAQVQRCLEAGIVEFQNTDNASKKHTATASKNLVRSCIGQGYDDVLIKKTANLVQDVVGHETRRDCGNNFAFLKHGLAPSLLPIEVNGGLIKVQVVNKLLSSCNASEFTIWVGVYGVEQHGMVLNATKDCTWTGTLRLLQPGKYIAKAHLLYNLGDAKFSSKMLCDAKKGIFNGIEKYSLVERIEPVKFVHGCCELCTREEYCTHWTHITKERICTLYNSTVFDPNWNSSSVIDNPSILRSSGFSKMVPTTHLLSSQMYFKSGSWKHFKRREVCGENSDRLLMGWKRTFVVSKKVTTPNRSNLPRCKTTEEMEDGRWVLSPHSIDTYRSVIHNHDKEISEDLFEGSQIPTHTKPTGQRFFKLKRFWQPDNCRLEIFDCQRFAQCLVDRGIETVYFWGDSMLNGWLKYIQNVCGVDDERKLMLNGTNSAWPITITDEPPTRGEDLEASLVLENKFIVHAMWHGSLSKWISNLKKMKRKAVSTIFLGSPYIFSEREEHVTGPRSTIFNRATKEILKQKNIEFVDFSRYTKSRGYVYSGYGDGLHYGYPEYTVLTQVLANYLCPEKST